MDNETKVTYSVIAVLIIILGALAYMLQPMKAPTKTTDTYATTTTQTKPLTTQGTSTTSTTTKPMEQPTYTSATITTNKGVIEIAFDANKPLTVANFGKLASTKFYDGVRFHRIIKNFMIQTGDPYSKDITLKDRWGTGDPGYKFKDENVGNETYPQGTVAMANSGPNTNGSQFFIVTAAAGYNPPAPAYTVFGHITKGLEVALAIESVATDPRTDQPLSDVVIQKIEVR